MVTAFFQSFDNREISVCIWGLGLIFWALIQPTIRSSILALIHTAFAKPIIVSVAFFASYFLGLVWLLSFIGIWAESQIKLTFFWFFSVGLTGFAASAKESNSNAHIQEKVKSILSISVLFDFFINLYRMPLYVEILFVPFSAILTVIVVYSGYHKEYKDVERFGNRLLTIVGFFVVFYAIYKTTINYKEIATIDNARALALPVIYSLGVLPIFWFFMIYVSYEEVFIRIPFVIENVSLHQYAKLSLIKAFLVDTKRLSIWLRDAWCGSLESTEAIDASIADALSK